MKNSSDNNINNDDINDNNNNNTRNIYVTQTRRLSKEAHWGVLVEVTSHSKITSVIILLSITEKPASMAL